MLLSSSETKGTLILPKENWLKYVRRDYATAITFPCLILPCVACGHVEKIVNNGRIKYDSSLKDQ